MTRTIDKFTARNKTTPTFFVARHKVSSPCPPPTPPPAADTFDYFLGPFDSWINVKNPPATAMASAVNNSPIVQSGHIGPWVAAVGDGIADDTDAIQWALDFAGMVFYFPVDANDAPPSLNQATDPGLRSVIPGQGKSAQTSGFTQTQVYSVVYLPAGIYRITSMLKVYNRLYVCFIGEDPETTIIKWDGPTWTPVTYASPANYFAQNTAGYDMFLSDKGTNSCHIRRITFDGSNRARTILNISTGVHMGYDGVTTTATIGGSSTAEILDCKFINAQYAGIFAGGPSTNQDDTTLVKRCYFGNIGYTGFSVCTQNTVLWCLFYNTFENCYRGLNTWTYGMFSVYNCLFLNTVFTDITVRAATTGVRGNVSIATTDVTIPAEGWRMFLAVNSASVESTPFMVHGNLVVNAAGNTGYGAAVLSLAPRGPMSFIDNAFYDWRNQTAIPNAPLRTTQPYFAYNSNSVNPSTGLSAQTFWIGAYYSGNVYNGVGDANDPQPTGPDPNQTNNPVATLDQTLPAGYIPANGLNITQDEIAQLLVATSSSPIIQAIKNRMPKPAPRIDPQDTSKVQLAEVPFVSGYFSVGAIANLISNADPNRLNVIHFGTGNSGIAGYTWTLPANVPFHVCGDGPGSIIRTNSSTPIFTVGDNLGSPVKFRIDDINLVDAVANATAAAYTDGFIHIKTDDTGRVYMQYPYPTPPDNASARAKWSFEGFHSLKVRADHAHITAVQSIGNGQPVTSAADVMVNLFGGFIGVKNPVTMVRLDNNGSFYGHDLYGESQGQLVDLRGGSGWFFLENCVKQQPIQTAAMTPELGTYWLSNFSGSAFIAGGSLNYSLFGLDYPASGSYVGVMGVFSRGFYAQNPGFYGNYQIYQAAVALGAPTYWSSNPVTISFAPICNMTIADAQNTPNNLSVGSNVFSYTYAPYSATGGPSGPVIGTLTADIGPSDLSITVTGLYPMGGTVLKIDDEIVNYNGYPGPPIVLTARGQQGTTAAAHFIGAPVIIVGFVTQYANGANMPESQPQSSFFPIPEFRDAMRFRPFPDPPIITDPTESDIVIHRVSASTYRPWFVRVVKTP